MAITQHFSGISHLSKALNEKFWPPMQPQLHGLFLQHQDRLACLLRSEQLLTAVVMLTSIIEKEIHYCQHQGLVYA